MSQYDKLIFRIFQYFKQKDFRIFQYSKQKDFCIS